jgi:hypothetical protein
LRVIERSVKKADGIGMLEAKKARGFALEAFLEMEITGQVLMDDLESHQPSQVHLAG